MDKSLTNFQTKAEQDFADLFADLKADLPGTGNTWTSNLREQAFETYGSIGLPHRRIEEWKYTDLRARISEGYPFVRPRDMAPGEIDLARALGEGLAAIDAYNIVVVDGVLREDLSDLADLLVARVDFLSLEHALAAPPDWLQANLGRIVPAPDDPVVALNAALMSGGAIVRIPDGTELAKPVHLIHVSASDEPSGSATRHLVLAGANTRATVIESYGALNEAAHQRNVVSEMSLGEGARIDHIKVQREALASTHLSTWMARLGKDADYRGVQITSGAALSRNQAYVRFDGEGASSDISGAYLLRGQQHCDTTMMVDHAAPHGTSRELFKAVLDDSARGIVQCKVTVRPHAQKSDGHQMAHALLLSEGPEFDSKPELEIFADDVLCGHGSTSGQIDEELLFYLRARGVPLPQARAMLVQAFIGEALDKVGHEALRDVMEAETESWLAGASGLAA